MILCSPPLRRHLSRLHEFIREELASLQQAGALRDDESAASLAWLLINVAIGYGMIMPLGLRGQSESISKVAMQKMLAGMVAPV